MQELIIKATEVNPRDIKRFINSIVISHEIYGLKALKKDNPAGIVQMEEIKELPDDYDVSDPSISTDDNPIV
jgi:hypothetical protein